MHRMVQEAEAGVFSCFVYIYISYPVETQLRCKQTSVHWRLCSCVEKSNSGL